MNRRVMVASAACILIVLFASHAVIAAGWVDQWMSHKVVASPVTIHDESRTIASLGGVSMRWPTPANEPFVTFAAPHFKAGCGGIDIFFGGMNYVNLKDAFQRKLEMLINSMPAIGLQLALAVFNEPLKNVIQSVQAATDWINGLQQDDCALSQDIVNSVQNTGPFAAVQGAVASSYEANKKAVTDGLADGWGAFKQSQAGQTIGATYRDLFGTATAHDGARQMLNACPQVIQDLGHTSSGLVTMLENAGYTTAKGYATAEIANVGRVLVGDFYTLEVDNSDTAASAYNVKFSPRDPHLGKAENIYDAILTGQICQKVPANASAACTPLITQFVSPNGITYTSIQQYVDQNIDRLMAHMTSNTPIVAGSDEEVLATSVPNTYTLCKSLVMMGVPDAQMVKTMAENEFVFRIIIDLTKVIGAGTVALQDRVQASAKADGACSDEAFLREVLTHVSEMGKNLQEINKVTSAVYYAKLEQTSSVLRNYQVIRSVYSTLVQEGRKAFNDSVMERVTGVSRGI